MALTLRSGWYATGSRSIGPNTQEGSTVRSNATPIMRGAEYGQAATLSRGCFAHASEWAGSRVTVRTMQTRILEWEMSAMSNPEQTRDPLSIACELVGRYQYHFSRIDDALNEGIAKVFDLNEGASSVLLANMDFMKKVTSYELCQVCNSQTTGRSENF
jgi:hypothetical protein